MPHVFIPSALRDLSAGQERVEVAGATVREVVEELERRFPGFRSAVCQGDRLRPGLSVAIEGVIATLGLLQPVPAYAELHFLPALGGG